MIIPPLKTGVLIHAIVIYLLLSSVLFAVMKITNIKKNAEFYDVVLNNDIKIAGILLRNNVLEFPKYIGKNKTYKQFSILKRDFKNYLLEALLNNKTFPGEYATSFKVNKMLALKNNKSLKSVCFGYF